MIYYHNPPTCQEVVIKASFQITCMLLLVMPMAYIYVFTANFEPFHRGFFCGDQALKHPYLEQSVPITLCITIWALASIICIVLVETLRVIAEKGRDKPILRSRTPWIAVELYRHFGYYALGAVSCLLFTEIAKYTIGRLRPHFLTICAPEYSDELCKDGSSLLYEKFVVEDENEICKGLVENGGTYTKKQLHEARLSFLSGHSSFSFFCATFLVVYLQSRLANFPRSDIFFINITFRTLKVARPFIQFALIILAFWISLTRISDYFHHPYDVATGALVGIIFACVTLVVCADIFSKRSVFWRAVEKYGGGEDRVGPLSVNSVQTEKVVLGSTPRDIALNETHIPYVDETRGHTASTRPGGDRFGPGIAGDRDTGSSRNNQLREQSGEPFRSTNNQKNTFI